jgi:hypothetical protein
LKSINLFFFGFLLFLFLRSADEERLQILEDNEKYIEKLRKNLRSEKEKEEQILRDKMKADLE